jgi:putative salt-induced outer membrane protein YdiY
MKPKLSEPLVNSKQNSRSLSMRTLMFAMTFVFLSALRCFCADPVAAPTLAVAPVLATNYLLVTNMVVITNYIVTTNVVFNPDNVASTHTNDALPDLSWVPPEDSFDWIQLKSGEWLKGRLKAVQERKLEFYSEELDDLTFDWKDIRQVRAHHILDVLSVTGENLSGPVTVTPDQVLVGGAQPRVFSREQIQSLTPGGSKELDYWSGKVSLGLNLQTGNTRQVAYNASANLQRRTPETRFTLDYLGNLSSVNGVENANNHRVNSEFDYWLSQRFYVLVPSVEYYKDPFQNLADRVTLGGGLGYDIVDRPTLEWNITTGPAYQYAWFEYSEPGEPTEKGTAALAFSSRLKWDIAYRTKLTLEYRGQYTSREVGETTHHGVSTLSFELTKRFDLDVSFIWDRISNSRGGAWTTFNPSRTTFASSSGWAWIFKR